MEYSRHALYALGEPFGDSATRKEAGRIIYGGGGGGQPKSTTQITELPAWARGYAKDILAKGAALTNINTNPYVQYGGQRVSDFSPLQQQSFEGAANLQYNPVGQQYTGENVGQYMNPYLQNALAPQLREAASAGMMAQNMDAAKAVGQGAFGGTRGALQQSLTQKNVLQNMSDINARGYSDAFNQAAGMFNTDQARRIQEAQFGAGYGMDVNKLQNTYGQQQQAQQQRGIDVVYQNFLDEKNYPYKQLGFMSDLIKNPAVGSRSQTQMYENSGGNTLGTVAGLGAVAKGAGLFKEGGVVGYADGGYVERLSDQQIATLLEQEQRKSPQEQDQERIVALAAEIQRREEIRGAQPMDRGIAALPTGTVEGMQGMAGGGIVAFAEGAAVKGDPKAAYRAYALEKARVLGIDPAFADAIFQTESGYNPAAKNPESSATGIGQLVKKTGRSLGLRDEEFTDPYKNIDASLALMATLNKRYGGDPVKMAMAYHDGETVADKHLAANKGEVNPQQLKPAAQGYLEKVIGAFIPSAQAQPPVQPQATSYSPDVAQIPGAAVDPRQTFRGPPAPPSPDKDLGGLGRFLGALEGVGSIASTIPGMPIAAVKSLFNDRSLEENLANSVYSPRTETGQGVVQGAADVAEALKLPPYIGTLARTTGAASRVKGAQQEAKLAEQAAAAAKAKVEAPRLSSVPANANFTERVRGGLGDIARKDVDQAAAAAARAEASAAPYNVQGQMRRAGDEAANANYAQGVADRTAKAGRMGLGAAAAAGAPSDAIPSGLAAVQATPEMPVAPVTPEELSKDDKKSLIDAAKATVPADERKKTGFDNEDWLMLGLNMLARNTGGKGFGQVLGEAGLPTLMNKKEREKAEKERESQKYVDEYRQSQAELNRAQAEYYGEGRRVREADAAAAKAYENWLATEKANKMTVTELTPEKSKAAYDRILRETYERFNIPLPAGIYSASPQTGATLKYDAATGTIK